MTEAAKALRDKVISIARTELGYKESPPDSNMTKYGKWYGLNGQPWCMMFVMWDFDQAGILSTLDGIMIALPKRTASCSDLKNAAKSKGQFITDPKKFQPGDVLIYTFGHTGILESVMPDGNLIAIEGNTGLTNQANGGQVMRRNRRPSQCHGAVRPDWEAAVKVAQEAAKQAATATPTDKPAIAVTAQLALNGIYGNGDERKERLAAMGYTKDEMQEIQHIINLLNGDGWTVCVNVQSSLNIRSAPGKQGRIIGSLTNGATVTVTEVRPGDGSKAGWGRIAYNGKSGWISLDWVATV